MSCDLHDQGFDVRVINAKKNNQLTSAKYIRSKRITIRRANGPWACGITRLFVRSSNPLSFNPVGTPRARERHPRETLELRFSTPGRSRLRFFFDVGASFFRPWFLYWSRLPAAIGPPPGLGKRVYERRKAAKQHQNRKSNWNCVKIWFCMTILSKIRKNMKKVTRRQ